MIIAENVQKYAENVKKLAELMHKADYFQGNE
jgi:hypothetical protein